jgi:hypothetical protein
MTTIIIVALTIAVFAIMKYYSDEKGRIPPSTTPRGRQARILATAVLVPLVLLLVWPLFSGSERNPVLTIVTMLLIASLVLMRSIRSKNRKQ